TIVMVCIISILLTAPAGAIIVSLSGTRLLTKDKPSNEQWRSGPRPSIRDITLNSEDEENSTSVSNDLNVQAEPPHTISCPYK
ncbi:sodium/hydrogen exchanger 9B1 isoform X3, partial [Aphis craccivora]